jgi:RNA polymerase sigma factor (sigma-70 family)
VTELATMPYEALYTEHMPAARRLALSLVPPDAAEDIVAEAFTRVLATAQRRGAPLVFRPYLLAAVRNTARTWHTRSRRLVLVPDPEPEAATAADDQLEEREDARLARRAFDTLPARWQAVLWATAVEETPVAELATTWGMAPNTISQLASRAREGLRQAYLAEHLDTDLPAACREVAPFMGAAVRGHAGQRNQARLFLHLRGCEPCSEAYSGLSALNTRLGELLVPALAAGGGAVRVLPAIHHVARGLRGSLRVHLPAALVTGTLAVLGAAAPLVLHNGAPSHHGSPGASGAALVPGRASTSPVLADAIPGDDGGDGLSLPGGDLPGIPMPGGQLPGIPDPGGLLPGGQLPGGDVPGGDTADVTTTLDADTTGASVAAGAQAGQVTAGVMVSADAAATPVPAVLDAAGQTVTGTAQAAGTAAGHAAGQLATLLAGQSGH